MADDFTSGHVWFDGEWSNHYGCVLSPDATKRDVVRLVLWSIEGATFDKFTDDEVERLEAAVYYQPLLSVVAADRDHLGDEVQWHSEGSGKRVRQAWWLDSVVLNEVMDSSLARHKATG